MPYPVILNGDHAEFEAEHANTPPHERPDWPLPSFDARDWANAFLDVHAKNPDFALSEEGLTAWFANALMRGFDEHAARHSTGLDWLIWSNEHHAWWGANRAGYYKKPDDAGRYSFEDAMGICRVRSWEGGVPPETMVHISAVWFGAKRPTR